MDGRFPRRYFRDAGTAFERQGIDATFCARYRSVNLGEPRRRRPCAAKHDPNRRQYLPHYFEVDVSRYLMLRPKTGIIRSIYTELMLNIGFASSMENSYDTITWERITAVKTRILQIWDNADPSVQICCIKFAQKVVLSQSVSGMEPRVRFAHITCLSGAPITRNMTDPCEAWRWPGCFARQDSTESCVTRSPNARGGSLWLTGPYAGGFAG